MKKVKMVDIKNIKEGGFNQPKDSYKVDFYPNSIDYDKGLNKKKIKVKKGDKLVSYLEDEISKCAYPMAFNFNNQIKSLNFEVNEDGNAFLVDLTDANGKNIYIRGLLFVMCMAIKELYPDVYVTVEYNLINAMFITIKGHKITQKFLDSIKERMNEIIAEDLPIEKRTFTKKEALEFYEGHTTLRGYLQTTEKDKDEVTLYFCKEYFNYFYGVMPVRTGYLKVFDLKKHANGFIVQYPDPQRNLFKVGDFQESRKVKFALDEYNDIYQILGISTLADLNEKIRTNPKELILLADALHEKKIYDLSKKIRQKENVRMILIAGPTSSGKTTFAGKLSNALKINGLKPKTISVDNYFVEREDTPRDEHGNYDFETIGAIDTKLFNEHLEKLLNGEEVCMPTFDFTTGHKYYTGKVTKLAEDEILIIEGIHCLNDKLTSSIPAENKFKIYISALTVLNIDYYNRFGTTDTRLIRRTVRDFYTRNYSCSHTLAMWYSVVRGERKNIFPFQENADFVFNSSVIYELNVLRSHIEPLLKEITKESKEYAEAKRLLGLLQYFENLDDDLVPNNSLLREFIGNSLYED